MAEIRVCAIDDVATGAARRFDVDGYRLCVVRLASDDPDGSWFVVDDRCSHADYSLSEGDVWVDECEIECPKHGSTFSLLTGEAKTLPATQPVRVYPVRVVDAEVIVEVP
jgi:3-phenylpropionate/trans-cinnamate dioxygenase ferredoxin subunit